MMNAELPALNVVKAERPLHDYVTIICTPLSERACDMYPNRHDACRQLIFQTERSVCQKQNPDQILSNISCFLLFSCFLSLLKASQACRIAALGLRKLQLRNDNPRQS